MKEEMEKIRMREAVIDSIYYEEINPNLHEETKIEPLKHMKRHSIR